MIFSEKNANIAAALARAWSDIQTPKYNAKVKVATKQGGSYTFEYTDLNGILETVKPIFSANKLSIHQHAYTTVDNNMTMACVETTFLHESGEYVKSYPLKFPAAQKMQDFGGQITYMKRYSLAAMLGIATEKDDDANGVSGNNYQYQERPAHQQTSQKQTQQQRQPQQPYKQASAEHKQPSQQNNKQQQYQNQQPQQSPVTGLIDAPNMYELTNLVALLSSIKGLSGDKIYSNSLKKLNIQYKNSNQLTMQEAKNIIGYLQAVVKTVTQGA